MKKTILANTSGFTPVIDDLVSEFDHITALVFGKVWRYCQMNQEECFAAIGTIADDLKIGRNTVIRRLDLLVEKGYLSKRDGIAGGPKIYTDTGKAGIEVTIAAGIKQPGGYPTVGYPGYPTEGYGDIPQRDTKIESKKEKKKESILPKKQAGGTIQNEPAQPSLLGQEQPKPEPKAKPEKKRDPLLDNLAVKAYQTVCHITPNEVQRQLIADKVTDVQEWTKAITAWMAHGWSPRNVNGQVNYYETGTYKQNGNGGFKQPTTRQPEQYYGPSGEVITL